MEQNPYPLKSPGSLDINAATLLRDKGVAVGGYVVIRDKRYEHFAAEMGKVCDFLLVTGTDWKVIPLENLIAELQRHEVKIIFGVKSAEEARLAFQTLETGADGVLLDSGNPQEIKDTIQAARELENESTELESAVVTRVEPLGMGDQSLRGHMQPHAKRRRHAHRFSGKRNVPGKFRIR